METKAAARGGMRGWPGNVENENPHRLRGRVLSEPFELGCEVECAREFYFFGICIQKNIKLVGAR